MSVGWIEHGLKKRSFLYSINKIVNVNQELVQSLLHPTTRTNTINKGVNLSHTLREFTQKDIGFSGLTLEESFDGSSYQYE